MGKELGSKKREKREAMGGGERVKILVFIWPFSKKRERKVRKKKGKRASWNSFLFFSILKGKEVVLFFLCVLLFRKKEVPSAEREVGEQAIERVALGF